MGALDSSVELSQVDSSPFNLKMPGSGTCGVTPESLDLCQVIQCTADKSHQLYMGMKRQDWSSKLWHSGKRRNREEAEVEEMRKRGGEGTEGEEVKGEEQKTGYCIGKCMEENVCGKTNLEMHL